MMILAALLAMLLVAFTPLVLAQQTEPSDVPADSGVDLGLVILSKPFTRGS